MYYAERNNLLNDINFKIDLDELKEYFLQVYNYYKEEGYFLAAEYGVNGVDDCGNEYRIISPTLVPSPQLYFMNHLHSNEIWPIKRFIEDYDETIIFTVIEILHEHIGKYDNFREEVLKEEPREKFRTHINNILKLYNDGYMLDEKYGIITVPNIAMKELLNENIQVIHDDVIIEQLQTAMKMYFKHDSNLEIKKKSINILADILEPLRDELKEMYGDTSSNKSHDRMIFGIVNGYNIRHNNDSQMTDYDKEVWYDWMVQYYTSVIIAYYKLKNKNES